MSDGVREYRYRVDRDGRVWHDETEIVDPATLRFFLLAMQRTPDGRHLVVCQGERNWFEAEGTPFVVQRLRPRLDARGGLEAVELELAGGLREPLDPGTLASVDGVLHCRVRRGAFLARFGRVAIQQIAPYLEEDGTGIALVLAGRRFTVRERDPAPA